MTAGDHLVFFRGDQEITVRRMRLWVIKQRPELTAYYQRRGYQFTGATLPFPDDSRYGIPKVAGLCLLAMEKALPLPA